MMINDDYDDNLEKNTFPFKNKNDEHEFGQMED